ncbi:methyl-accepting chemotaxis protein [Phenylobacterium deserti]|uniref:methyl-accepting chemotaxis protein n=1 Tax=Phenylobacterium deserti TaxID=1914756 RepID=UPI001F0C8525|nr:methyl-accepting chemotaxis protein [Phenylobacterium deserti]
MLNNLKFSWKLILAFTALVLVTMAGDALVLAKINEIRVASEKNDRTYDLSMDVQVMFRGLVEQQNAIRGFVLANDPAFLETYQENAAAVDKAIDHFASLTSSPEQKERALKLKEQFAAWRVEYGERPLELSRDPATRPQAYEIMGKKTLGALRAAIDEISRDQDKIQNERMEAQKEDIRTATFVLIGGAVVALISSLMIAWLLAKTVAQPVVRMTNAMRKLAAGDNTVEVPGAGRKDEIGDMAGAVQSFKDAAIEKLRLEGMTAEQHKAAEEERRRTEAAKAEAARQLSDVVENVASGLEKLSKGELTFRIDQAFPAEYEKLRADFNEAMQTLQDTMKVISGAAHGIRSGTDEISQASEDLSRRTEQQAASLEETAAALDEITATVRKTSEGANHAREVVSTAKRDAEHSGEVVRQAISAMTGIEQSSNQIGNIIGVIDEIAFQTNLLALNAGVEAARAGDAGKGFAVVASEVRALAQRSADAAKEIKTLISASSTQVEQGVTLVGQTGEALNRIVTQVADINSVVSEIAASAQEQATGLQQVNTAVNQMDQVTQQNAAMVEQSTAASHSLSQETEELARLVGRFQVGAPSIVSPTRRGAPAPAAAPAKSAAAQPGLKTLSTHAGGGGALRKPQPVHAHDTWEEF